MSNIKLTERSDGTVYLQCRCGEIGQPCPYQGEITYANAGISLLRQAKVEAFDHCWQVHRLFACHVSFEIARYRPEVAVESKPFLVTTAPAKVEEIVEAAVKKA